MNEDEDEDDGTGSFGSYSDHSVHTYFGFDLFDEFIRQAQARASAHNTQRGYGSEEEEEWREYLRESRRKEDEERARRAEEEKLRVAAQKKVRIEREEEARINAILQEDRIHDKTTSKINKKKKNAQVPSRKNCSCQGCQDRFLRESNEKNQSKHDPEGHAERMRIRKEVAARKEKEAADKARQEAERLAEEQRAAEKAAEEKKIAQEKAIAEKAARDRLHQLIAEQEAKRRAEEQAAAEEDARRRKMEQKAKQKAKQEAKAAADRKAKEDKEAAERKAREFAERKAKEAAEREAEEAARRLAEQEARNAARLIAEQKAESARRAAQEAARLAQQKAERDAEELRKKQETEDLAARRREAHRTKKPLEYISEQEAKYAADDKEFDVAFARDLHEVSHRMKKKMDREARNAKIQCKFGSRCKYVATGTCHYMHEAIPQGLAAEPDRNPSALDGHQHGSVEYVDDTPEQNHRIKTQTQKLGSKKVEEVAHHEINTPKDKHTTDQGHPAAATNGISLSDPNVKLAFAHIQNKKDDLINGLLAQGKHVPAGGIPLQLGWDRLGFANKCHFCGYKKPKYAFRCPEGGARACGRCKKGFSLVTPEDEVALLSRSSDA
jgi:hypothetical protein